MPAPPATLASDAPAPLDRQIALLERLAEIAMEVAEANGRLAVAAAQAAVAPPAYVAPPVLSDAEGGVEGPLPAVPTAPAPGGAAPGVALGDPTLAFTRASRAVRMSVALWSQLVRERQAGAEAVLRGAAEARLAQTAARQARAGRVVERIAHDHFQTALPGEGCDGEAVAEARAACAEARERLADEDFYGDLVTAPFSEIVARLCADVGLSPDWPRLAEEPWAQAEIAGGVDGGSGGGEGVVGAPLAPFARAARSATAVPEAEPRPPRNLSARWRRRHEETPPPEAFQTLKVEFIEAPVSYDEFSRRDAAGRASGGV